MPFQHHITHMVALNKAAHEANANKHSLDFFPEPQFLPNLVLKYPGKKDKIGDYRLQYYGHFISHPDIVRCIYHATLNGHGQIVTDLIVNIYTYGLNANSNFDIQLNLNNINVTLTEFKYIVYWTILQEDINYPRPRCRGIRLPLTRYIEGAIAANQPDILNINDVIISTNNHGRNAPPAFEHERLHPHFTYLFNQIR